MGEGRRLFQGLKNVTIEKPISNRTNGKCGGLVRKRFSFGNTEFEALAHENLTP